MAPCCCPFRQDRRASGSSVEVPRAGPVSHQKMRTGHRLAAPTTSHREEGGRCWRAGDRDTTRRCGDESVLRPPSRQVQRSVRTTLPTGPNPRIGSRTPPTDPYPPWMDPGERMGWPTTANSHLHGLSLGLNYGLRHDTEQVPQRPGESSGRRSGNWGCCSVRRRRTGPSSLQ